MRVIGIDVAPAKGGHVCEDGSPPQEKKPCELDRYLQELPDDVLIAWDAPLTGPPDPDAWTDCQDLTTRQIERFFGRGGPLPAPAGISVRSYCGCPHWTISRRLLGLPRVGPYDVEAELPFRLVTIWLGTVEAPGKKAAIEAAAKEFKTDAWRLYAVPRR